MCDAWSLTERAGWLRLKALPADDLPHARNTLTQKLWDDSGIVDVHLDLRFMADGQRAGLTFISGSVFDWVGVGQQGDVRKIVWERGAGPTLSRNDVWLRGRYDGNTARLAYSLDGREYAETGVAITLRFGHWKGARIGIFNYGRSGGVDVDFFRYQYGESAPSGAILAPFDVASSTRAGVGK